MILYLFGEPELVLGKAPAVDAFPTVALSSDKLYVHGGVGRSIKARRGTRFRGRLKR